MGKVVNNETCTNIVTEDDWKILEKEIDKLKQRFAAKYPEKENEYYLDAVHIIDKWKSTHNKNGK